MRRYMLRNNVHGKYMGESGKFTKNRDNARLYKTPQHLMGCAYIKQRINKKYRLYQTWHYLLLTKSQVDKYAPEIMNELSLVIETVHII